MRRRCNDRGFTLLEVLVALVIALAALNGLYGSIASTLRTAQTAAGWQRAVSLAQSRLAAAGLAPVAGEQRGDSGDGYRWITRVDLLASAAAPRNVRSGPWARGTALYRVAVNIVWNEGRAERRFVLDSALLGTAPGTSQ